MSWSNESIFDSSDEVVELVASDFDTQGRLKKKYQKCTTIIMFYSPSCGHCHHTKPAYTELAKLLDPKKYCFTSVNCSLQTELPSILEQRIEGLSIDGFPTIVKFKKGKYVSTLQGGRSKEELFHFTLQ